MKVIETVKSDRAKSERGGEYTAVADEGLVVLDLSLRPVAFDRGAATILKGTNGRAGTAITLPNELLKTLTGCTPSDLASFRSHFRMGNSSYACRSYLIESKEGAFAQPLVALYLQRDCSDSDAITRVAMLYGLTVREQEALRKIATGLTSKEVAEQMGIKPNTVKAFLRLIMIKMGVATRAGLVGKLLEHQNQL